jgi:hypothetical protein
MDVVRLVKILDGMQMMLLRVVSVLIDKERGSDAQQPPACALTEHNQK